ncbi:MAG: Npun_F5749 family FMN-dependent PPOX-type flavoprotein [Xenococcaceae cyanobacterium]
MPLAPWRSPLARALHLNRSQPYSRYMQLATVTKDGFPANRTVVFREFLDNRDRIACAERNRLKTITDSRSDKIEQIQACPWGEICWYFTKTREQFRLFGSLILVTVDCSDRALQQARQETWQNLSDSARQQFSWPNPKQNRTEDKQAYSIPVSAKDIPLDNFCLLLLEPNKVDYLELRGEPQNRTIYILQDSQTWQVQAVNP